jgi:hypothetical protein
MAKNKVKTQTTTAPDPAKLPVAVPIAQGKYMDASLTKKGVRKS